MPKVVKDISVAIKMVMIKKSAQDRGLPYDMTFADTKKLLTAKYCYFTKVELTNEPNKPNSRSFDRIDNSTGYLTGNVVPCTVAFNQRKGNITVTDIELLYKLFVKRGLIIVKK